MRTGGTREINLSFRMGSTFLGPFEDIEENIMEY